MTNSSGDNEIFVKITADHSELDQGMEDGAVAVVEGTQTMQAAIAESATSIAASNAAIGESAESATARIKAMVASSLEQQAANSGIAESETSLAERMGLRTEATEVQLDTIAASIAAQNAQMVGAEGAAVAEDAVTVSTDAATVATEENTAAMVINAGVARELGVEIGEFLRGNYSRMGSSAVTLGNRMGLMNSVFSATGLLVAGSAAAVAGFTYEVIKGEQESDAFNKAIINTGGALGVTEGQFNQMARAISGGETTIGSAREAMLDFAQSGRIGGETLQVAGQAAVDFASLTGISMDKAVAAIVKIQEDPVKAIRALNDQYHFLSLAQLDHIQKLEDEGQKTEAAAAAITAFQQTSSTRLQEADQDVGTLVGWWRSLKSAVSDAGDEIQAVGRKQTLEDQIVTVKKQIDDVKAGYKELGTVLGTHIDVYNPFHPMVADTSLLEEKLEALQRLAGDNRLAASQKAAAVATQDAGIAAGKQSDEILKGMKSTSAYNDALQNELALLKQIHSANADDARTKDVSFDKSGNASGGEGLAKIETYLHKKYDIKAAAHQSEHKLDEAELAKEEADEGISYDQRLKFEIDFWGKKLDAAKKGSTEYATAYRQLQTLQKQLDAESAREADKAAKAELAAKLAVIDSEKAAYDEEADASMERYQREFADGQITASRLAELEKDLVRKKLAADVGYLNDKMTLDKAAGASAVKAAQQEAAQIEAVKRKAAKDISDIEKKSAKDSEKVYQQASQQIARSFGTAIKGMLFEGQTLKQGMGSIAESMAEQFIEAAIEKPLEEWIAKEAAMLTATIGTLTGQATATDTQRAADAAADATASLASVARAAGVAGAQGVASFAGAPWPVDIGAPAFGAAMALDAASYATVASAAGGWDNVPADQLALIHKNEMVLPAHVAQSVRDGAAASQGSSRRGRSGGDSAGPTHIHIHTLDSKSMSQYVRKNAGAIAHAVKGKTANNATTRM